MKKTILTITMMTLICCTAVFGQKYTTISFADAQKRLENEVNSEFLFTTNLDPIYSDYIDVTLIPFLLPGTSKGYNLRGNGWANFDPKVLPKFFEKYEPGIYFLEFDFEKPVTVQRIGDSGTKTKLVYFYMHEVYLDLPVGKYQLWAVNTGAGLGQDTLAQTLIRNGTKPDRVFRIVDVAINTNPKSEQFLFLEPAK